MSKQEDEFFVIVYPAGGAFNKLRSAQTFLDELFESHWQAYSEAEPTKKAAYVRTYILDRIHSTGRQIMRFDGRHPDSGRLVVLEDGEAMEMFKQKLRDVKKRELSRWKTHTKPPVLQSLVSMDSRDWSTENNNAAPSGVESHLAQDDAMLNMSPRSEIMDTISHLREQVANLHRLCDSQRVAIAELHKLNDFQHELLLSKGLSLKESDEL